MLHPDFSDLFGVSFERGGRGPEAYDCYGLVREMYRRRGVDLPDFESPGEIEEIADVMSDATRRFRPVPDGTPGSIATFRVEGVGAHVGYVLSPTSFLHITEAAGVSIERLLNGAYKPIGFYDFV